MNTRFKSKISKFENYLNPKPIGEVILFDWLTDFSLRSKIELIRTLPDKKDRDAIKKTLPAVTISGLFSHRSGSDLIQHSGLIQFDVDKLTPEQIEPTKAVISAMPYTIYCATSASGLGLWGFFEISNPEKHLLHFSAMEIYFKSFDIEIDTSCKDVSRLRGYSFDLNPYVNKAAQIFDLLPKPVKMVQKPLNIKVDNDSLFDSFNLSGDVMQLLVNHGYKYSHSKGTRHRFTRPDKADGVSVDFCEKKRIAYYFTDATEFKPSQGYNACQVFYTLNNCKDWKECAQKMKQQIN